MKTIIDDEIKGLTTTAYVKVCTFNIARVNGLTFIIRNRGAVSTLKYKLLAYANKNTVDIDDAVEYVSETELAISSNHEEVVSKTPYVKAELYVKSGTGKTEFSITATKQMQEQ